MEGSFVKTVVTSRKVANFRSELSKMHYFSYAFGILCLQSGLARSRMTNQDVIICTLNKNHEPGHGRSRQALPGQNAKTAIFDQMWSTHTL